MFWVGLIISFCSGLVGIGLSRDAFKKRFPRAKDFHLDWASLVLLTTGLVLASIDYQGTSKELILFETELRDFKSYEWLARLDMFARPVMTGGGLTLETDLTKAFNGFYEEGAATTTFRNDPDAIQKYREIASSFPKFPLPHYVLAVALYQTNAPEWEREAENARETIYRITLIPEHHGWYDDALKILDDMLQHH